MNKTLEELEEQLKAAQAERDAAWQRQLQASERQREAYKDAQEAFDAWQRANEVVDNAFDAFWDAKRGITQKPVGDA
jgi:hypothetical protein